MIRELRPDDVPACIEIVRENWGDKIAKRFEREVAHAFLLIDWPPIYYVYCKKKTIYGFAGMNHSWIHDGVWDFIWINIKKEYQGHGIGKKLTKHRIKEVKKKGGQVIHLLTKEPKFFHKLGFYDLHHYYWGEGWMLMGLQLEGLKL